MSREPSRPGAERRPPADPRGLPPGQRAVAGFPRFGTHLHRQPPGPTRPRIRVEGAITTPREVGATELAALPRRQLTADFHCVAGWSATALRWEGVAFADFCAAYIQAAGDAPITHVVFGGLDGYRVVVELADALADGVLIADRLDGRPLDGDHGAPLRLVSPMQYGFVSCKHLCLVEGHTKEPDENYGFASTAARILMLKPVFARHPRSRVWAEERNRYIPAVALRGLYRAITPPIRWLSARGSAGRYQAAPPASR